MRFNRSIASTDSDADVRVRITHYLQAVGYKQRASEPFMIFERGSTLGSLTGFSTRRWQSRALVEVRSGETGVMTVLVAIDVNTTGQVVTAGARAAFEHELDGLAVVVRGSGDEPAEDTAPSAPSHAQMASQEPHSQPRIESQFPLPSADVGRLVLMARLKNGASWFYWIAALSVINSIGYLASATFRFVVSLGFTQAIDQLATKLGERAPEAATAFRLAGIAADLLIAGLFVLLGWNAIHRRSWAFFVGISLYVLDAVLFLLVKDYLAVGFHLFALYGLFRGLAAHRRLTHLERG